MSRYETFHVEETDRCSQTCGQVVSQSEAFDELAWQLQALVVGTTIFHDIYVALPTISCLRWYSRPALQAVWRANIHLHKLLR
jgi:hypothetical protein